MKRSNKIAITVYSVLLVAVSIALLSVGIPQMLAFLTK